MFWNNTVSNFFLPSSHAVRNSTNAHQPIVIKSLDHSWREIGGGRNIFVLRIMAPKDTIRKAPPPYLVDGTGPQVVGRPSGLLTITDPNSDTYPYPNIQYSVDLLECNAVQERAVLFSSSEVLAFVLERVFCHLILEEDRVSLSHAPVPGASESSQSATAINVLDRVCSLFIYFLI